MDRNFSDETRESANGWSERGSTSVLVLILLLLVAIFGYLYFFTGLIKPREETPPPVAVSPKVKQPLPPREGEVPAKAGEGAVSGAPIKPEGDVKKAEPVQAAKPAAMPEQKAPSPTPAVKTATPENKPVKDAPPIPQPAPVSQKPAKAEEPKPKSEPKAKTEAVKPVPVKKEIEKAGVKAEPKKEVTAEKGKKPVAKAEKVALKGKFTLSFGDYVLESAMAQDKAKIRESGLTPVVTKGPKKPEPMTRLVLGEFKEEIDAKAEMIKAKKATKDLFILPEGGKFYLYAGSYYREDKAALERDRLAGLGLKPVLKKSTVSVPVLKLTAGNFATRDAAEKQAASMKKKGLSPTVVGK